MKHKVIGRANRDIEYSCFDEKLWSQIQFLWLKINNSAQGTNLLFLNSFTFHHVNIM